MTSVTAAPARNEVAAPRSALSQVAPLIGVFALAMRWDMSDPTSLAIDHQAVAC